MAIVIEGIAEVTYQDWGQAAIAVIDPDPAADEGVFVRVQSWHEIEWGDSDIDATKARHTEVNALAGKRLRVTVEVLD